MLSEQQMADGCLMSGMDGQRALLGSRTCGTLRVANFWLLRRKFTVAALPIDESPLLVDEVEEALARLRDGKAGGICKISVELLKTGGVAMIQGFHLVLTGIWQFDAISLDWKTGLSSLYGKGSARTPTITVILR